MKKILAGIMAFTMLFGMAYADNGIISEMVNTVSVSAETLDNGLKYEVNADGTGITIKDCDKNATAIEIPAEIDGLPVTSIGNWTFENCTGLTTITIPDSVTSIGYVAFGYCYDDNYIDYKIENFTIYGVKGSAAETGNTSTEITGDVNGDGEVTSADALMILQSVVGMSDLTEEQEKLADLDGNGEITSSDALIILQIVVGIK